MHCRRMCTIEEMRGWRQEAVMRRVPLRGGESWRHRRPNEEPVSWWLAVFFI
jgi:hypothetical protein